MSETQLTRERILEQAELILRRYGPDKATVVDVARALGVSHGSVYRHFPSKAALRDAVTAQWLARLSGRLTSVVNEPEPAPQRLRAWFDLLIAGKRKREVDDPELFATYVKLIQESREIVKAHIETLIEQVTAIVASGMERGEFTITDARKAGEAIFYATARFHDPVHAAEWADPGIEAAFDAVWMLLMRGIGAKVE